MAEGARLESVYRGNSIEGSNPSLTATHPLEVVPALAFSHSQQQGLVLVDTPEGISTVASQRRRAAGPVDRPPRPALAKPGRGAHSMG